MIILAIQLLISFLGPTFRWGSRHIFLSDVFCFLCIGPALIWVFSKKQLNLKSKKRLLVWTSSCAGLLGFIYLHGYFRPPVEPLLRQIYFRINPDNDTFNAKRELIFYFRFLSWLTAAGIISTITFSKKDLIALLKTLTLCMASASFMMVLDKFSPAFHHFQEVFYNRDSSYDIWKFRSYGPFSSPVEGGAVLGLGLIFTLGSGLLSRTWLVVALLSGFCGLILTHTMTAVVALCIAGAFSGLHSETRANGKRLVAISVTLLTLFVLTLGLFFPGALTQKRLDVFARLDPWLVLFRVVISRWDLTLFGLGLPDYSVDNAYLFILIRSGFLGVACLIWLGWRHGAKQWQQLSATLRATLIYVAVSGIMFDIIVYRNVVYLMLAVGLPLLSIQSRPGR